MTRKKEEINELQKLNQQVVTNGVDTLQIIDFNRMKILEHNIEEIAALYSPETAITSPYFLTIALAENALGNGVEFFLNTRKIKSYFYHNFSIQIALLNKKH